MEAEQARETAKDKAEESSSGRWIRDQLRDVADSSLAALERSAAKRGAMAAEPEEAPEQGDQAILENLANSISSAVMGPMRNLERNRASFQHQTEAALATLAQGLEEAQTRVGALEQALTRAEQRTNDALAQVRELRPGVDRNRTTIAATEQSLRRDMATLQGSLDGVGEQVRKLAERLAPAEQATERQAAALRALAAFESRKQEAARELMASLEDLSPATDLLDELPELVDIPLEADEPDEPIFDDAEPHGR
ncbi:MAG: hypothetical protein GC160_22725 [Acidobacteria bacterium]|nr:hypothetical protein [Acidobacteriota bacterium]